MEYDFEVLSFNEVNFNCFKTKMTDCQYELKRDELNDEKIHEKCQKVKEQT
jgi:hypothetical protein